MSSTIALPVPPQSSTSSSTPGATLTMRILCGVRSSHAAGLWSVARAAVGAPNVSSATAPRKDSRSDCISFTGTLPPPAGHPEPILPGIVGLICFLPGFPG